MLAIRIYDVGHQVLLEVKMALEEWWHWLEGASQPFVVWPDQKNIKYLKSVKRMSTRPRSKNVKCDALAQMLEWEDKDITSPEPIIEFCVVRTLKTLRTEGTIKVAQTS